MKKTIILAYLALLLTFILPIVRIRLALGRPAETEPTETAPLPSATAQPQSQAPASAPIETAGPEALSAVGQAFEPAPESIVLDTGEDTAELGLDEYLVGVLAAEMPASFHPEALKAQAVAARTYAMYCALGEKHGQAQVCADFACCQAWTSPEARAANWGDMAGEYEEKLRQAVAGTSGQYLSYEGQPIFAAFHSSSAGATEDCGQVWNPRPYLISVPSPETAQDVPNYISVLNCAPIDFRDALLSLWPEADFSGEESGWIGEIARDASGRVSYAVLGGVEMEGTELRSLFSLRSTAFSLEYTEGRFVFTVTGFGHGVGMSQYGAQVMAEDGQAYSAILAHYYPNTVLNG